jgi:hypothetical protein
MQTEPQHCRAQVVGTPDGTLPEITDGTCEETDRTWTVIKTADGGLVLEVSQQVSPISFQTANHTIPPSELLMEQTGATRQQRYTGPTEFDLE